MVLYLEKEFNVQFRLCTQREYQIRLIVYQENTCDETSLKQ